MIGGADPLVEIASLPEVHSVMAAIVGAAGLRSTLAAARAGKRLLLANKESLVMAGPLLMETVRAAGATLLPIDSEHNAVFQCLPRDARSGEAPPGVKRILLTASGGPFLDTDRARLDRVTPEEACAHPNWVMGRKISVDSATLMNKGLEFIEACLLFGVTPQQVEVADPSREHRALAGRIRRRLGARAARRAGHAHARSRTRWRGRSAWPPVYNRSTSSRSGPCGSRPRTCGVSRPWGWRRRQRGQGACGPHHSTPPMRWPCRHFSRVD